MVQFSLGWIADDRNDTFRLLWGSGGRVDDPQAQGGTAFRLGPPGDLSESSAWMYTTTFYRDLPLVAYVRLKVASNTSSSEVARIAITNNGGKSTRSIKGTDFKSPNIYQEFPVPFTFGKADDFLIFQFWRSGSTDVFVDGLSVFTAPQPYQPEMNWQVPGGVYRGQGVWLRYTDGGDHFSAI